MERSIDELLSGEPVAEPEIVEAPEPEPQGDDRPRDEHGRFAPKQTGVDEEPPVEAEQPQPVEPEAGPPPADHLPRDVYEPLKAVRNENKELKAQLEAIQQQLARQQPPREQQTPAPSAFDEDAFWTSPKQVFDEYGNRVLGQVEQLVEQRMMAREVAKSFTRAKTKYADFDQTFEEFDRLDRASGNLLTQQALATDDPAEFAYKTAQQAREVAQYGSIPELLKAERAKWEAEARAAIPAPAQTFPSTAATDGSVGVRSGPAWSGPKPINELLG